MGNSSLQAAGFRGKQGWSFIQQVHLRSILIDLRQQSKASNLRRGARGLAAIPPNFDWALQEELQTWLQKYPTLQETPTEIWLRESHGESSERLTAFRLFFRHRSPVLLFWDSNIQAKVLPQKDRCAYRPRPYYE